MDQPLITPAQRVAGGLVGLLVGDALGVPYEFNAPEKLPPAAALEYTPPPDFRRSHAGITPGTWSDDGAQALCLLASLLECNRFDPDDFSQRLVRWNEEGYLAVDDYVFDIGITTSAALNALQTGVPPLQAGPAGPYDNGNGALMRVLPLALWHTGSDQELVRDAQFQSCVTHGHLRSQVCCALYCLWARQILAGNTEPWEAATATLRQLYSSQEDATRELEWSIRPDDPPSGNGTGYVVDCLNTVREVLSAGSYEEIVRAAIRKGHDTDTTACVAGGIAGLRDGLDAIPERWRIELRGQELYEPLLERLLNRL